MAEAAKPEVPGLIARLKAAIRDCGLSLNQLGKMADVDNGRLSRFMTGQRDISLEAAEKVMKALGLDVVAVGSPPAPVPDPPPARSRKASRPTQESP